MVVVPPRRRTEQAEGVHEITLHVGTPLHPSPPAVEGVDFWDDTETTTTTEDGIRGMTVAFKVWERTLRGFGPGHRGLSANLGRPNDILHFMHSY